MQICARIVVARARSSEFEVYDARGPDSELVSATASDVPGLSKLRTISHPQGSTYLGLQPIDSEHVLAFTADKQLHLWNLTDPHIVLHWSAASVPIQMTERLAVGCTVTEY